MANIGHFSIRKNLLMYLIILTCIYGWLLSVRSDNNSTCESHTGTAIITIENKIPSGTFRLMNGSSEAYSEGMVEVFHDGRWGAVCNRQWDIKSAGMVCRSMGFSGAVSVPNKEKYGSTTGIPWLDRVKCPWGASTLNNCTHNAWGSRCLGLHKDHATSNCTNCQVNIGHIENYPS